MSTFVVDIDNTLSISELSESESGPYYDYDNAKPRYDVIKRVRALHTMGHRIVLYTARGMRTYSGDLDKIKEVHHDRLVKWLERWSVPYDELILGKLWFPDYYFVDDRNLTIEQFITERPQDYSTTLQKNSLL